MDLCEYAELCVLHIFGACERVMRNEAHCNLSRQITLRRAVLICMPSKFFGSMSCSSMNCISVAGIEFPRGVALLATLAPLSDLDIGDRNFSLARD